MDQKQKADFTGTYILDEDVMDEMESFEITQVLNETQDELLDSRTEENEFLEDAYTSTVVLGQNSAQKKS